MTKFQKHYLLTNADFIFASKNHQILVIENTKESSEFTKFYNENAYLQEVKSLCLMQVSHKVQPKRNVAENYT